LEEDRMVMMKDIMWAFANAVSQVCVEDDGVSFCIHLRLRELISRLVNESERNWRLSNPPMTW
jgi:hypothetical protein